MVIRNNKRFFNGQSFARKDNYGTVSCFRICRSSLQAGTDSYFLHIYQSMHSLLLIVRNHGGARAINGTRVDINTWKAILDKAFNPNTGPLRACKVWADRGPGTLIRTTHLYLKASTKCDFASCKSMCMTVLFLNFP